MRSKCPRSPSVCNSGLGQTSSSNSSGTQCGVVRHEVRAGGVVSGDLVHPAPAEEALRRRNWGRWYLWTSRCFGAVSGASQGRYGALFDNGPTAGLRSLAKAAGAMGV